MEETLKSILQVLTEIREEVYKEIEGREKIHKSARREVIARECLFWLVSARPKESPEMLAKRAVDIADAFSYFIDKD